MLSPSSCAADISVAGPSRPSQPCSLRRFIDSTVNMMALKDRVVTCAQCKLINMRYRTKVELRKLVLIHNLLRMSEDPAWPQDRGGIGDSLHIPVELPVRHYGRRGTGDQRNPSVEGPSDLRGLFTLNDDDPYIIRHITNRRATPAVFRFFDPLNNTSNLEVSSLTPNLPNDTPEESEDNQDFYGGFSFDDEMLEDEEDEMSE